MSLPIRVLIGYLEGVKREDAVSFARNYAERHFDALDISYYYVQAFDDGFLWEIHEGGNRKAFLPSVIELFDTENEVYIETAERTLRLARQREGVEMLLLPESATDEQTQGIKASAPMKPVEDQGISWLIAGGLFFLAGLVVVTASAVVNHLIASKDVEVIERGLEYQDLPVSQINRLYENSPGTYIKALKYQNGEWVVERASIVDDEGSDDDKEN